MATKTFITNYSGQSLVGDERDIMVSRTHYLAVIDWCKEHKISVHDSGTRGAAASFGVNLWRVEDDAQRVLFMLRWS